MNSFDTFMTIDHRARQRVMITSVVVGAGTGLIAENLFKLSTSWAVILCLVVIGITEIVGGVLYVEPDRRAMRAIVQMPTKRRFIEIAGAAAALFSITLLDIPGREALASERRLVEVSNAPSDPKNINEAKRILTGARAANIRLMSLSLLEETGIKFLDAGIQNQKAWDTAMEFLAYRSFLNASSNQIPRYSPSPDDGILTKYTLQRVNDLPLPVQHVSGIASPDSEALLDFIGQNQNHNLPQGRAYAFLDGGYLAIDRSEMRNVVLNGVTVYYHGDSTILTNVYFINCKFVITLNPNGKNFSKAELTLGPSISFAALG